MGMGVRRILRRINNRFWEGMGNSLHRRSNHSKGWVFKDRDRAREEDSRVRMGRRGECRGSLRRSLRRVRRGDRLRLQGSIRRMGGGFCFMVRVSFYTF